jgi:hypothetical protein
MKTERRPKLVAHIDLYFWMACQRRRSLEVIDSRGWITG